jgi:hypothetical protein
MQVGENTLQRHTVLIVCVFERRITDWFSRRICDTPLPYGCRNGGGGTGKGGDDGGACGVPAAAETTATAARVDMALVEVVSVEAAALGGRRNVGSKC